MDALGWRLAKFYQHSAYRMTPLLGLYLVSYVTLVNVNDEGEL